MPGAAEHLAHALLADPDFLGELAAAGAELAAGTGGVAAVSRLLDAIAARTPRTGADEVAQAAAAPVAGAVLAGLLGSGGSIPVLRSLFGR
ncbi:hypothetical protein [Streptomyces sp. NPDC059909]|uniref:hypothetical protein n=1 Tax=Streptomyces sp. NPDC059909 TaxID=3346998 RepID=UPI00366A398F